MSITEHYPRFTTFRPGEREALLRRHVNMPDVSMPSSEFTTAPAIRPGTSRRNHVFPVTFPDNAVGACWYERLGPSWHVFHYTYRDGTALPHQYSSGSPAGDAEVESLGQSLATQCYRDACRKEQRDYFSRATLSPDGNREIRPERYRIPPARLKKLAGKYAVCLRLGKSLASLIPKSGVFETLDEANARWREENNTDLVVACCNRLDRCWEIPRFNPLYAVFDPRPAPTPEETENAE